MGRNDTKTDADATIATLEQTNGELAEQLGLAQDELTETRSARDNAVVRLDQINADLAASRARIAELESQLSVVDGQLGEAARSRDEAQRERDVANAALRDRELDLDAARRELDRLPDERGASRPSGAPLSLDLAALTDLARLAPDEPRYHAAARRLGDQLAAQILDDHD